MLNLLKFEKKSKVTVVYEKGVILKVVFYIKISTLDGFRVNLNRNSLVHLSNNFIYVYTVLKN